MVFTQHLDQQVAIKRVFFPEDFYTFWKNRGLNVLNETVAAGGGTAAVLGCSFHGLWVAALPLIFSSRYLWRMLDSPYFSLQESSPGELQTSQWDGWEWGRWILWDSLKTYLTCKSLQIKTSALLLLRDWTSALSFLSFHLLAGVSLKIIRDIKQCQSEFLKLCMGKTTPFSFWLISVLGFRHDSLWVQAVQTYPKYILHILLRIKILDLLSSKFI